MIIVSLLLVIALERSLIKTPEWRIETYIARYRQWLQDKNWLTTSSPDYIVLFFILAPGLLLWVLESWLLGGFLSFILQTLLLYVCMGCPELRATYRCFLQAADRGDLEACSLYARQLGHRDINEDVDEPISEDITPEHETGRSFGQQLIWLNYQHYAAVILFFIAFGAPGALIYCVARQFHHTFTDEQSDAGEAEFEVTKTVMHVLDFVPVRITSLGFLLMGHFSRALPVWLDALADTRISAIKLLTSVAAAAEMTNDEVHSDIAAEPVQLVRLAKRNILFLLVVTALLTLTGNLA
ncbi:beta-lactamase regulator AmpE [Alteromonas aestuariivivens]|uniref:Beta-lactamase regulator AmpE n=1 Tax=Alteromonas aestuariivivens TaxID=1938339 RepID=A0A3D8MEP3_9ALTE|nr:beta-lactamase regulator AmpE [Alteromonas aestuariivivens]RDV29086.1 beta-lactamase regulator AmpE [Alteromonas aestuariivivens]